MATTNIPKITGKIVRVSRRRFLNVTAGAIATTGAVLIPQPTMASDTPMSLEQLAHALHEAIGHHSALHDEVIFNPLISDSIGKSALGFFMETCRHSSVEEIQCLLETAIGGVA